MNATHLQPGQDLREQRAERPCPAEAVTGEDMLAVLDNCLCDHRLAAERLERHGATWADAARRDIAVLEAVRLLVIEFAAGPGGVPPAERNDSDAGPVGSYAGPALSFDVASRIAPGGAGVGAGPVTRAAGPALNCGEG
jgi:hypothetical protein